MSMDKKRVAIVGAGVSGLAACKHLLERGCRPVVFEADDVLGGVWAHVPDCTKLQTPRPMYQYSDFPWPDTVTEVFPDHRQVTEYLESYARHFGVLDCIRFGHRVVGMEYDGVDEEAVAAWEEWAGNGEAFGSGAGEWRLDVADAHGRFEVRPTNLLMSFATSGVLVVLEVFKGF
jgi:dimethylaniline monooxygenase (N-oxide forming)